MEGKELAEFRNKILEELVKYPHSIHTMAVYNAMGNPLDNYEHFEALVKDMTDHFKKYIRIEEIKGDSVLVDGSFIVSTAHTKEFLKNGGFVAERERYIAANKAQWDTALIDGKIKTMQLENLKLGNRLSKQKLKTHYVPIVISIISLGFAAYSLLKPSNNVPQEQYDTKIESIEKELQQLRTDFKQENDQLKDRLYKAEMLIAIYESHTMNSN